MITSRENKEYFEGCGREARHMRLDHVLCSRPGWQDHFSFGIIANEMGFMKVTSGPAIESRGDAAILNLQEGRYSVCG